MAAISDEMLSPLSRARIRLIHWNPTQAALHAAQLADLGYIVDANPLNAETLRALRTDPPFAAVIDLCRSPNQGRDLGVNLRVNKATRTIRLVFAGGTPEKVAEIRALLPDVVFVSWDGIAAGLAEALRAPANPPIVPSSLFAAYSGTPLVKKLGIRPGMAIATLGEPDGFREKLADLPDDVRWMETPGAGADLVLWFARSQPELSGRIGELHAQFGEPGLWIIWPKKGSSIPSDLSERIVRETGLAAGWVDYKIAAIDATWSGVKFAWRKV